jgi:hypothetical protein
LLALKKFLIQPECNQDIKLLGLLLTPFPQDFLLGSRHLLFFQLNFSRSCATTTQQLPRLAFYRLNSDQGHRTRPLQASAAMEHAVDRTVEPVSDQALEIAVLNIPGVVLRMPTVEKDASLPLESAL